MDMGNNNEDKRMKPRKVKVVSQGEKFRKDLEKVVEKNLSDPEFGINTLCDKLFVSRATLFRKVKAITGESPKEFIKSYRLDRAAQLLREDFGNVTEVSEEVGFSDPYYFSKCFKQKFSKPPKQYQLEHSAKNKDELLKEQEESEQTGNKLLPQKPLTDYHIEELDAWLIFQSIQKMKSGSSFMDIEGTPQRDALFKFLEYNALNLKLNEALTIISPQEIFDQFEQMMDARRKKAVTKNANYSDERLEFYDITDNPVRMNARAVAAVCFSTDLIPEGNDFFKLKTKTYGPTFNLHETELFYNQPIAAGRMSTGVLVGKDTIAIPPHFVNEKNVDHLRFVFDFVMEDPVSPAENIPLDNIYKAAAILDRVFKPGSNWALVKLDRNVTGRETAILSQRDIFDEQPLYVIGHPCGLPLKYAPGANARKITNTYFRADLDVYSGSSGSPIFCADTHELIGTVSRGNTADYRWTEAGWITLRYPKTVPGSICTRTPQFSHYIMHR